MAFLDFIRNRGEQPQPAAQETKPETAKQMYAREAAQEKTNAKPVQSLGPEGQAKAAEAKELFRQGTEQISNAPSVSAPAPTDGATSPQPMRQAAMNQDKAAPELSPTSAQAGTPATEREAPAAEKTPEQAKRTMPRATPSWER